jgi:hypothetical protein
VAQEHLDKVLPVAVTALSQDHSLLVVVAALALLVARLQALRWLVLVARACLLQSLGLRLIMLAAAVVGYMPLAEPLALADQVVAARALQTQPTALPGL